MGGQTGFEVRVPIDQALARRTSVFVLIRHIDEVLLAEAPVGLAVGGQRLRDVGGDARLLALQDLVTLEVATIGNDREVLDARGFAGALRHRRQLGPVVADVGDFVRDDQVVFVIDRSLDVVANNAGAPAAGGHGPCIRIGQ